MIKAPKQKETEFSRLQLDEATSDIRKPLVAFAPCKLGDHGAKPQRHRTELRIPGALSIDPIVRRAASEEALTVSESAIWVIVIAARQYAMTILKSCAEIKKSSFEGNHLRVPQPRPHTLMYKPKPGDSSRKSGSAHKKKQSFKGPMRISPLDIHTLVTQLPMGEVGSHGGTVSRACYETTLMNSFDMGAGFTSNKFDDLRRSIVAKMMNAPPPPATKPADKEDVVDRQSPHGGLGRGAKDLASLKLRSTVAAKKEGDKPSEEKANPAQEPTHHSSVEKAGTSQSGPSPTQAEQKTEDQQQGDAQAGARRGKGYGVKNLRAMLARNKPGQPESGEKQEGAPSDPK